MNIIKAPSNHYYDKHALKLLEELQRQEILESLSQNLNYPDEPQFFHYTAILKSLENHTDGQLLETAATGFSSYSASYALLKCLMEVTERFSTTAYKQETLEQTSYNAAKSLTLDPCLYLKPASFRSKVLNWVSGYDLITRKNILIPAQSVYYNYKYLEGEPVLTPAVSTGSAGGFDHHSTLLRGIYEILERDSFMTIYLAKIKAPMIDTTQLNDPKICQLIASAQRYNLEVKIFNLTTDLNIPTYLGAIIDNTGIGPALSLGLKSSLRSMSAILGCLEEALHVRPWMRNEMLSGKTDVLKIQPSKLTTIKDRGRYWLSIDMTKHLNFLLDQSPTHNNLESFNESPVGEYNLVLNILKEKNLKIFYTNITPNFLKNYDYLFYKTIIPELQPIYFDERHPAIMINRVRDVARYFGIEKFNINRIPHPFL